MPGSHTIGLARCTTFRPHIYNDSNIDASFAKALQRKCPISGNDNVHQPLDFQTPTSFDNLYFDHLLKMKGLLRSDQELFNGTSADSLVKQYAADTSKFFKQFAKSMIKMGNIKPLTGSSGQIRINCRKVNWKVTDECIKKLLKIMFPEELLQPFPSPLSFSYSDHPKKRKKGDD